MKKQQEIPAALNNITDIVLAYRPKPKAKPKKRKRPSKIGNRK